MARQVVTKVTDDIDGSIDATPVTFGLRGKQYEIDLSGKNEDKLDKALAPFISRARVVRGPAAKPTQRSSSRDYDLAALREWARKQKVSVPARGRVPQAVVDRFKATTRP